VARVHVLQIGYDDQESSADRLARVEDLLREQEGADLVVLPELWFGGGFSYDRWHEAAQALNGDLVGRMRAAARGLGSLLHMGSFIEVQGCRPDGSPALFNTSLLIDRDGLVLAQYRKFHRFGFAEGEPRYIEPGDELTCVDVVLDGGRVTIGMATCYDLRFPEQFRGLVDEGAELVLLPAAWPLVRIEHWSALGVARSIENQFFLVQCNTAGEHAGISMGGSSAVIDPFGQRVAAAGVQPEVLVVDIDLSLVPTARRAFPVLNDRRLGLAQRR